MTARWVAVVLSWNGRDDTLACLRSLTGVDPGTLAVICVDNGSIDGSVAAIRREFPTVTLIENGANLGFSGGNNVGIRAALEAGAEWVVLVNNDATVASDFVEAFEAAATQNPKAGALCGKVFFAEPSDRIWFAGQRFSATTGYSGRPRGYGRKDGPEYAEVIPIERAVGAFMAVSRSVLGVVGLLDDELFAYVEDVDWSLRIRAAGFDVLFVPGARAWHRVSASTGGEAVSTHTLYYGVRNTIAVTERHRPLPIGVTTVRRFAILATFALHGLRRPGRKQALAAVVEGYRDARAGRYGERSARS